MKLTVTLDPATGIAEVELLDRMNIIARLEAESTAIFLADAATAVLELISEVEMTRRAITLARAGGYDG